MDCYFILECLCLYVYRKNIKFDYFVSIDFLLETSSFKVQQQTNEQTRRDVVTFMNLFDMDHCRRYCDVFK